MRRTILKIIHLWTRQWSRHWHVIKEIYMMHTNYKLFLHYSNCYYDQVAKLEKYWCKIIHIYEMYRDRPKVLYSTNIKYVYSIIILRRYSCWSKWKWIWLKLKITLEMIYLSGILQLLYKVTFFVLEQVFGVAVFAFLRN